MDINVRAAAERFEEYVIEQRRWLHSHPELPFEEVLTTARIREELESMGVEVEMFPDYQGAIGTIRGGKPGKTVLLRADIDALPIQEDSGLPFAATNGRMHACGHDCHAAMLLGAAKILTEIKDKLSGEVRLLFQSAEESTDGAGYYVQNGHMKGIDAGFAIHVWSGLEAGLFSVEAGERMASLDSFKIVIRGISAHGAQPHTGRDAIVAASSVVMNLQTLASRFSSPFEPLVFTVGIMRGGQAFNIIADEVELIGSFRTYSQELRAKVKEEASKLVRSASEALGCTAEVEFIVGLPPVVNDSEELNRIARDAVVKLYGEESLVYMERLSGSEDFPLLVENIPGFYGFLGCRSERAGAVHPHHNEKFRVDESALVRGTALYAQFAADYLLSRAD